MKRDKKKELAKVFGTSMGITGAVAVLFFNCIWLMLVQPLVFFVLYKIQKKRLQKQRTQELSNYFIDAMKAVSAGLMAGLSMENAWIEAQKELLALYGKENPLYQEFCEMNKKIAMSVPIEELLYEFSIRTKVEDIELFAEVFSFAKRGGSNMTRVIESTTHHIKQKQETAQQIRLMIAAKRYEAMVMDIIPVAMLIYLRVFSPGYLDVLYEAWWGRVFMLVVIVIYVFAIWLAEKIMNISV